MEYRCYSCNHRWTITKEILLPNTCPYCGRARMLFSLPKAIHYIRTKYGNTVFNDKKRLSALLKDLMYLRREDIKIINLIENDNYHMFYINAWKTHDYQKTKIVLRSARKYLEEIGLRDDRIQYIDNAYQFAWGFPGWEKLTESVPAEYHDKDNRYFKLAKLEKNKGNLITSTELLFVSANSGNMKAFEGFLELAREGIPEASMKIGTVIYNNIERVLSLVQHNKELAGPVFFSDLCSSSYKSWDYEKKLDILLKYTYKSNPLDANIYILLCKEDKAALEQLKRDDEWNNILSYSTEEIGEVLSNRQVLSSRYSVKDGSISEEEVQRLRDIWSCLLGEVIRYYYLRKEYQIAGYYLSHFFFCGRHKISPPSVFYEFCDRYLGSSVMPETVDIYKMTCMYCIDKRKSTDLARLLSLYDRYSFNIPYHLLIWLYSDKNLDTFNSKKACFYISEYYSKAKWDDYSFNTVVYQLCIPYDYLSGQVEKNNKDRISFILEYCNEDKEILQSIWKTISKHPKLLIGIEPKTFRYSILNLERKSSPSFLKMIEEKLLSSIKPDEEGILGDIVLPNYVSRKNCNIDIILDFLDAYVVGLFRDEENEDLYKKSVHFFNMIITLKDQSAKRGYIAKRKWQSVYIVYGVLRYNIGFITNHIHNKSFRDYLYSVIEIVQSWNTEQYDITYNDITPDGKKWFIMPHALLPFSIRLGVMYNEESIAKALLSEIDRNMTFCAINNTRGLMNELDFFLEPTTFDNDHRYKVKTSPDYKFVKREAIKTIKMYEDHPEYIFECERPNITGHLELGYLYEKGLGVEKNKDLAKKYYLLAAQYGDSRAFEDVFNNGVESCTLNGTLLSYPGIIRTNNVRLSDDIVKIGSYAFAESEIKEVIIPGNVKCIGKSAFEKCTELERVIIENGVEEIEDNAFLCGGEKEVHITVPRTVKKVGENVFSNNVVLHCKKTAPVRKYVRNEIWWKGEYRIRVVDI